MELMKFVLIGLPLPAFRPSRSKVTGGFFATQRPPDGNKPSASGLIQDAEILRPSTYPHAHTKPTRRSHFSTCTQRGLIRRSDKLIKVITNHILAELWSLFRIHQGSLSKLHIHQDFSLKSNQADNSSERSPHNANPRFS